MRARGLAGGAEVQVEDVLALLEFEGHEAGELLAELGVELLELWALDEQGAPSQLRSVEGGRQAFGLGGHSFCQLFVDELHEQTTDSVLVDGDGAGVGELLPELVFETAGHGGCPWLEEFVGLEVCWRWVLPGRYRGGRGLRPGRCTWLNSASSTSTLMALPSALSFLRSASLDAIPRLFAPACLWLPLDLDSLPCKFLALPPRRHVKQNLLSCFWRFDQLVCDLLLQLFLLAPESSPPLLGGQLLLLNELPED